jgi:hypothetical protein
MADINESVYVLKSLDVRNIGEVNTLFDPSHLRAVYAAFEKGKEPEPEELAEKGHLLLLSHLYREVFVRLVVTECSTSPELAKAPLEAGGLLRVPSGQLIFGSDLLAFQIGTNTKPPRADEWSSEIKLTPGNYIVEAKEFLYPKNELDRRLIRETSAELGRLKGSLWQCFRAIDTVGAVFIGFGLGCFGCFWPLILTAVVAAGIAGLWYCWLWYALGVIVAIVAGPALAALLSNALFRKWRRRMDTVYYSICGRYPSVEFRLTKLPDDYDVSLMRGLHLRWGEPRSAA